MDKVALGPVSVRVLRISPYQYHPTNFPHPFTEHYSEGRAGQDWETSNKVKHNGKHWREKQLDSFLHSSH